MKINNSKNNIFIWSPMTSHVGTIMATMGMVRSLNDISKFNNKIFLINVFGEFNFLKNNKDFNLLNIFSKFNFPKTGIISKISIYLFSIFAFPWLFYLVIKHKPRIIFTCLVGYLPSLLKFFFKDLKVINSIQGYPRLNFFRSIIWKYTYKKSDCLISMTNKTRNYLIESLNLNENKIIKIDNPIISRKIKNLSNERIDDQDLYIFKKKVFCSIGRLTRQKNYLELIKGFSNFSKRNGENTNLIILGDGEDEEKLKKFMRDQNINNCFLLGFKTNPYRYLAKSELYICSSLWEEPGHTLIEAGYLNIPVLSSDCPNGPDELIQHNHNGLKYRMNNFKDLENKLIEFENLTENELFQIKINMKKLSSNFTEFYFSKKIKNYL